MVVLTYDLSSAKDLLEKLRRDAALLNEEVTSDRFFNFVVTGYSIIDWVKNDPTVATTATTNSSIAFLYGDKLLKVCGDIATASKHFTLTKRVPITADVSSQQGWGVGRWGKGGWGLGEESIEVTLNDGSKYSALDFVNRVLQIWDQFFISHGM
jgi:hypothetical protein